MGKIHKEIWKIIRETFNYRNESYKPLDVYGHYAGIFKVNNNELAIHTDGVGTKVLIAQELNKYDTIGIDAIAMSVNDLLCVGAKPIVGVDYLVLAKEDKELVKEIMKGLVKGAKESELTVIGGETAIMPDVIKGTRKPFDLAFTALGVIEKPLYKKDKIKSGQIIIGLESSGLHSNGFTLARKILKTKEWKKEMLKPTRIYVKPMLEIIKTYDVKGIAHITGTAFEKIKRLNANIGYSIKLEKPKGIFKELSKHIEYKKMVTTFNMGIGMIIIAEKEDKEGIIRTAEKHKINAYEIGKTIKQRGVKIEIDNKTINLRY